MARALTIGLAVLLAACGPDAAGSPPASTIAPSPSASVEPTATERPSPTVAADAAPPELAGRWRRSVGGVLHILHLRNNGYSVQVTGDSGAGRISVEADRIRFSHSNRCDGIGLYTWSIEDGRLRFTEVEPDPCGRADFLPRGTWGRVDE
jgi:hypothetical protein